MKVRLLAGAALAATALVVWSWLFWDVSSAQHLVRRIPENERFLSGAIETNIDGAGAYRMPQQFVDESDEAYGVRLAGVPVVLMFASREGREPDLVTEVGYRWVAFFGASLIFGLLTLAVRLHERSAREALKVGALAGLAVTLLINLSYPTIFWTPWTFFVVRSVFDVGGAILAVMISRMSLRIGMAT